MGADESQNIFEGPNASLVRASRNDEWRLRMQKEFGGCRRILGQEAFIAKGQRIKNKVRGRSLVGCESVASWARNRATQLEKNRARKRFWSTEVALGKTPKSHKKIREIHSSSATQGMSSGQGDESLSVLQRLRFLSIYGWEWKKGLMCWHGS